MILFIFLSLPFVSISQTVPRRVEIGKCQRNSIQINSNGTVTDKNQTNSINFAERFWWIAYARTHNNKFVDKSHQKTVSCKCVSSFLFQLSFSLSNWDNVIPKSHWFSRIFISLSLVVVINTHAHAHAQCTNATKEILSFQKKKKKSFAIDTMRKRNVSTTTTK